MRDREREREKSVLPFCLEGKNWPMEPSDFTRLKQKWRREKESGERETDELGLRPRLESRNNQLPRYEEAWATFEPNKVFFFFFFGETHIHTCLKEGKRMKLNQLKCNII